MENMKISTAHFRFKHKWNGIFHVQKGTKIINLTIKSKGGNYL